MSLTEKPCSLGGAVGTFHIDLAAQDTYAQELAARVDAAKKVQPELVAPEHVKDITVYKRFQDTAQKNLYRRALLISLFEAWKNALGYEAACKLQQAFLKLVGRLETMGAAIFAEVLKKADFRLLIQHYTKILKESGSESWIHSYVNLTNHPEFLTDRKFNQAFLYPLLIALVSYQVGGPVRVVDARGKDAKPLKVLAQDNMLHIDNTPFNDEYKVILTWERGKPSGPRGQNFVFLPGTHVGARQCMMGPKGPWSSENASIFITPEAVEQVFRFQERVLGKRAVVELSHDTKPLTTLFQAGALVHHRYRTAQGLARSCIILAFHRAEDNPGQLVAKEHLMQTSAKADALYQHLFGFHGRKSTDTFLSALKKYADSIAELLINLANPKHDSEEIIPATRELTKEQIDAWKKASTAAPTVEKKKIEANAFLPTDKVLTKEEFVKAVARIMSFDKHGPLDLILYPDAHEEIRKWARNQIREKQIPHLYKQLTASWADRMKKPSTSQLLTTQQLQTYCNDLAILAQEQLDADVKVVVLRKGEKTLLEMLIDL